MSDESIDVSDGANVLVLGGAGRNADRCCDALLDVGRAENRGELSVTFSEDVTDRARLDTGTSGRQSAKHGHVTIGDVLRSADHAPPDFTEPVATDLVEDPGDLKAIGTSVSRFCESWSESGHLMVLCFDSITELLERRDPKVVFQFLHTLLERLASVDTVAHFHLDPDRVDGQTVSTFSSLFDDVVDPATAEDLIDESGLDDAEDDADAEDEGPSLSDGIPATSGSSQASDDEIAARLDEHGEEYEVADGGTENRGASRQASDDDIAARIPDIGDDADEHDAADEDLDSAGAGAEDADADDADDADDNSDDDGGGSDAIAGVDDDTDVDDLDFDFG